jgi:hypothetical protein
MVALTVLAILRFPAPGLAESYETTFPLTEDPISEGGVWSNGRDDGLDWYNVLTNGEIGYAYGEVTTGEYTDPTAILKGTWSADQGAEGVVYSKNQTTTLWQEVELRLRSGISAHSCTGYEIFFRCTKTGGDDAHSSYAEIVRWNGPLGDWDVLEVHYGIEYGISDGDTVSATVVGNVIKGFINGVEVISAVDDTFTAGNPGIGFDYGVGDTNVDCGFTSYRAYDMSLTCGDGTCASDENCSSCPQDCGTCLEDDGEEPGLPEFSEDSGIEPPDAAQDHGGPDITTDGSGGDPDAAEGDDGPGDGGGGCGCSMAA